MTTALTSSSSERHKAVAIIGGGRWARVIAEVLCEVVSKDTRILACSPHNASGMLAWARSTGRSHQVEALIEMPDRNDVRAAIIANAARDHLAAAEWASTGGIPALIEKPVVTTARDAGRVAELASHGWLVASSNVFLFADYFTTFSAHVRRTGPVKSIIIEWADPRAENRYGELKRYDPALSLPIDILPHLVPLLSALNDGMLLACSDVQVERGGATVQVDLIAADSRYRLRLDRDAASRRRLINVETAQGPLILDFTVEPGKITAPGFIGTGDCSWSSKPRPLAAMLHSFLSWAAGGTYDSRLSIAHGLAACALIENVLPKYREARHRWLQRRLREADWCDEGTVYALTEMVYAENPTMAPQVIGRLRSMLESPNRRLALSHLNDLSIFVAQLVRDSGALDQPSYS